ncbi:uncharacterized protein LOC132395540 isoform X2 [Hypanus sabinus]|uniref:uncharacterized protein LOC132395540 isoform X2 n=1 Tax=Hypanus sabinus TaxID=79690 RepID=UPI0028C398B6|nr:uncharacterized protein LOC132395540 isoform X2 [Hypanus sabinus]
MGPMMKGHSTLGSFEDPDLELHADFSSLQERDPLSGGSHDWLSFDILRRRPRRLARLQGFGISWLWSSVVISSSNLLFISQTNSHMMPDKLLIIGETELLKILLCSLTIGSELDMITPKLLRSLHCLITQTRHSLV